MVQGRWLFCGLQKARSVAGVSICLFDFSVSCDGVEQSIREDVMFLLKCLGVNCFHGKNFSRYLIASSAA